MVINNENGYSSSLNTWYFNVIRVRKRCPVSGDAIMQSCPRGSTSPFPFHSLIYFA